MRKIFWALIVVAALFIIYKGILLLPGNSETTPNQPKFNFDASKYPLVIDKAQFPKLSVFETQISSDYENMLQAFAETFKKYGYICFRNPEVSELIFNHLKPRQNLYMIVSSCGVPGETSPFSGMPAILLYVSEAKAVMFYEKDVASHFTVAFNQLETLDEAKEYSEYSVGRLNIDIDSALNDSFLRGPNATIYFENDCDFVSDVPELASTISRADGGFVYEGLRIDGEGKARLYYLKYAVASGGKVTKEKEEMLAMCRHIGFVY